MGQEVDGHAAEEREYNRVAANGAQGADRVGAAQLKGAAACFRQNMAFHSS